MARFYNSEVSIVVFMIVTQCIGLYLFYRNKTKLLKNNEILKRERFQIFDLVIILFVLGGLICMWLAPIFNGVKE